MSKDSSPDEPSDLVSGSQDDGMSQEDGMSKDSSPDEPSDLAAADSRSHEDGVSHDDGMSNDMSDPSDLAVAEIEWSFIKLRHKYLNLNLG